MHKSVLLQETIDSLNLSEGDIAIDATSGAGGHTLAIAHKVGKRGAVLAIDQDIEALKIARNVTRGENVTFARSNFRNIAKVAKENGFSEVSAIMADLGVSSMQLDKADRGFSLKTRGVLDMRMDRSQKFSAYDIVNSYTEEQLRDIFFKYGEEPRARKVAAAIVEKRKVDAIKTTDQLAEVVRGVVHTLRSKGGKKIDPATKVFQAIRIEVNQELSSLESALPQMVSLLKKGGRIAIISFHSLEDRIVKDYFRLQSRDCICPPEALTCTCAHKRTLRIITRKPIVAEGTELADNPRARSAKLRVAEKM